MQPLYLSFWGKARPSSPDGPRWHPVAFHLLDVAAVAHTLLAVRPLAARRTAELLGLEVEDARMLVTALAGLHDIGKFTPPFQAKASEHWPADGLGPFHPAAAQRRNHTEDGLVLWEDVLSERLADGIWQGGAATLHVLAPAVFGHHGRPVGPPLPRDDAHQRFGKGLPHAMQCAEQLLRLLCPRPIAASRPRLAQTRIASWWVSGLLTIADWIGSNQAWFPFHAPNGADQALSDYWRRALGFAERAVCEAGLVPPSPSPERPLAELFSPDFVGTPAQEWATRVPLPEFPALFIIEDVTGAGKTEAAHVLVHRLMAGGRASGAYWAMPTMATANAMYARQERAIGGLFDKAAAGRRPSLVLAHGQQRLHDRFRSTVVDPGSIEVARASDAEGDSSVACAAFLADDRRAALLADVGAGTTDQALLGVLPSRFNTVRLFGLADKVIVIDEAHAYDPYMAVELHELLRFQAALGGNAVVLSATLAQAQRSRLVEAWQEGCAGGRRAFDRDEGPPRTRIAEYPLATIASAGKSQETPLATAPWSHRSLPVRLIHDVDAAVAYIQGSAAAGGAVAWVRNTVDDCLQGAERLRAAGLSPFVFHARFAQADRQEREREILSRFGAEAEDGERRGHVLVATQVIEQSLDLDFDAMVTDVAPIDLVIQRAGRLRRHRKRDPARPLAIELELLVLAPEPTHSPDSAWPSGVFRPTAAVYAHPGVLWRTVQTLAHTGVIRTPGGLRHLIESVYGPEAAPIPDALLAVAQRAEGRESAQASAATYAVLKPADGYHAASVAWLHDLRVPTRLGDDTLSVRLARVGSSGALTPWALVDGSAWKSWALSEIRVRCSKIPPGSNPLPEYVDAVDRVRATWGNIDQDTPVLPLVDVGSGVWSGALLGPDGKARHVTYTASEGLRHTTSQEPETTNSASLEPPLHLLPEVR